MEAVHLTYFETPKDDLKIHEIYRNEALLQEMESLSAGRKSLPDASRYYTTPVVFPKPGSDRPYIVSSIVLSADGKMAFMDNQVGPLIAKLNELDPTGGADDFWCLNMLRANSDGILVGARTLQNEPTYINNCMDISLFRQRQEVLGKPNPALPGGGKLGRHRYSLRAYHVQSRYRGAIENAHCHLCGGLGEYSEG